MNTVLLAGSTAWAVDLAFFVLLALGILIGVYRGFINGVCKIAGFILAIVVALLFCIALQNKIEEWFGMTTALTTAFGDKSWSATLAYWVANAICFVVLLLLVWFGTFLLGKIGSFLVGRSKFLDGINKLLGGILGLFQAGLLIFFILAVCKWIPVDSMHEFIGSSTIVGKIFNSEWFMEAVRLKPLLDMIPR